MQSEYAPTHQERRRYISNFTGSAGTALVTEDKALLWTDGRYFLQASSDIESTFINSVKLLGFHEIRSLISTAWQIPAFWRYPINLYSGNSGIFD